LEPVPRDEVPDYYDVITEPMDWETIWARLETLYHYETISAFQADVRLVFKNALTYNTPDTAYHRVALKIQASSEAVLEELEQLKQAHGDSVGAVDEALDPEGLAASDLEPSNALLLEIKNYEEQELKELMEACNEEDIGNESVSTLEDWVKVWHRLSANRRAITIANTALIPSSEDVDPRSSSSHRGGNRKKRRGGNRWTKPRDRTSRPSNVSERAGPATDRAPEEEEEEEEGEAGADVSIYEDAAEKPADISEAEDPSENPATENHGIEEPESAEPAAGQVEEISIRQSERGDEQMDVDEEETQPPAPVERPKRARTRSGKGDANEEEAEKEEETAAEQAFEAAPQIDEAELPIAAIEVELEAQDQDQDQDGDVDMKEVSPPPPSNSPPSVQAPVVEVPSRSRTRSSRKTQEAPLEALPTPLAVNPEPQFIPTDSEKVVVESQADPSVVPKAPSNRGRGKKRGYRGQFASHSAPSDDTDSSAQAKKARDEARKAELEAEHAAQREAADDADGEGDAEAEAENRKRRARIANPESLHVEELDSWDTFIRFEQGWVLPEGSTRRRVPPPQRPSLFTSTSTGPPSTPAAVASSSSAPTGDAEKSSDAAASTSQKGKKRSLSTATSARESSQPKGSSSSGNKRSRSSTSVSASASASASRSKQLKAHVEPVDDEEEDPVSDESSSEYFMRPFARNKDGHFVKINSADAVETGVMYSKRAPRGSKKKGGTSEERKENRKAKARARAKARTAKKAADRANSKAAQPSAAAGSDSQASTAAPVSLLNRSISNPLDDGSDSPLTEELTGLESSDTDSLEEEDEEEKETETASAAEEDGHSLDTQQSRLAVRREREQLRRLQKAKEEAALPDADQDAIEEARHQERLKKRRERDRARRERNREEKEGGGSQAVAAPFSTPSTGE